jgi:hypothetical protein
MSRGIAAITPHSLGILSKLGLFGGYKSVVA